MCEFALNTTRNSLTTFSPAYVLYGRDPILPLEHSVRDITDCPIYSVTDRIVSIQNTIALVKDAMVKSAETMRRMANCSRRDLDV